LQVAFNTAEHESTKASPFVGMFPFRAGSPLLNQWKIQELLPAKCDTRSLQRRWAQVKQNLRKSRARVEQRYNLRRAPNPFQVGDIVYYRNHPTSNAGKREAAKLMPRFKGPFRIGKFLTPVTAELVDTKSSRFITKTRFITETGFWQ
jgi:hypothetical protein